MKPRHVAPPDSFGFKQEHNIVVMLYQWHVSMVMV